MEGEHPDEESWLIRMEGVSLVEYKTDYGDGKFDPVTPVLPFKFLRQRVAKLVGTFKNPRSIVVQKLSEVTEMRDPQ